MLNILVECLIYIGFIMIGLLVMGRDTRIALTESFLVGVCTSIVLVNGLLLILPQVQPSTAFLVLVVVAVMSRLKMIITKNLLQRLAGFTAVSVISVTIVRLYDIVLVTNDSYGYYEMAGLLATGHSELMNDYVVLKRMPGYPSIHSIGIDFGQPWLPGFGLLILLGVADVITRLWSQSRPPIATSGPCLSDSGIWIVQRLGVLALLSALYVPLMAAFYANTHIFVASVISVCSLWICNQTAARHTENEERPREVPALATSMLFGALVVTRVEGIMYAAALLAVLQLCCDIRWRKRIILWLGPSLASFSYVTFYVRGNGLYDGVGLADSSGKESVILHVGLGFIGLLIVLGSICWRSIPREAITTAIHRLSILFLCLSLGITFFLKREILSWFIEGMWGNTVGGGGGWSILVIPLLLSPVLVTVVQVRNRSVLDEIIPALLYMFIGFFIWLSVFRGSGSRNGVGDSFNRMMIHLVPLGVACMFLSFERIFLHLRKPNREVLIK